MEGFRLEGVTLARDRVRLLDEISAAMPAGRCTAVVGPSGAGKSTLLRLLNRLEEATSGRVLLDGVPISEMDVLTLRRRVGLVGQRPVLLTDRVEQELRVGRPDLPGRAVVELLESVGLPAGFRRRSCEALSGGEAQRVCLARALAVEPQVLLLDEPTSALDESSASIIGRLARRHADAGGTVVLVSHDPAVVESIADHVLVIDQGRLVGSGPPGEVDHWRAVS